MSTPDTDRLAALNRLRGLTFDGRYLRLGGRAIADMRYAHNRENAEALVSLAAGVGFRDEIDVERLARALPDWMSEHPLGTNESELRHRIAENIAREYAKETP